MKRKYIIFAPSLLLVIGVCWWLFPSAKRELSSRGIPYPSSYIKIDSNQGGLFSSWYFIALKIQSNSEFEQYVERVKQDGASGKDIGEGQGKVKIIKIEDHDQDSMDLISSHGTAIKFKESLNGKYLDWWKTDSITHGIFYQKDLPNACQYKVYADRERQIIYIYWSYS